MHPSDEEVRDSMEVINTTEAQNPLDALPEKYLVPEDPKLVPGCAPMTREGDYLDFRHTPPPYNDLYRTVPGTQKERAQTPLGRLKYLFKTKNNHRDWVTKQVYVELRGIVGTLDLPRSFHRLAFRYVMKLFDKAPAHSRSRNPRTITLAGLLACAVDLGYEVTYEEIEALMGHSDPNPLRRAINLAIQIFSLPIPNFHIKIQDDNKYTAVSVGEELLHAIERLITEHPEFNTYTDVINAGIERVITRYGGDGA
jgi:hypothetical protein